MRSVLALLVVTGCLAAFAACGDVLTASAVDPFDAGLDGPVLGDANEPIDGGGDGDACVDCVPRLITTAGGRVSDIAVDATHVYFSVYEPASFTKVAIEGGPTTPILATGTGFMAATQIVLQGDELLLSQYGQPGVRRTNKANTKSAVIHDCGKNYAIAAGTTGFFASSSCTNSAEAVLHRFVKGDGSDPAIGSFPDPIVPDGGGPDLYQYSKFGYLALDVGYVYWSNARYIMRLPIDFYAGQIATVLHESEELVLNLAADDGLYVRTRDEVRRYELTAGGDPVALKKTRLHLDTAFHRLPLAVDAKDVYYSEVDPPELMRVGKVFGSTPELVATPGTDAQVTAITVAGDFVYWGTATGQVWRKHK